MAQYSLLDITVDGSTVPYNGFIYNLNYKINFSQAPNELTMNFISEDGTYIEPEIGLDTLTTIQIGTNFSLDMYPISYTKSNNSQGKTLAVKYVDESVKYLDKVFVGLHKRHGDRGTGTNYWSGIGGGTAGGVEGKGNNVPACILIVGQEFHPCDINKDGVVDFLGISGSAIPGSSTTGEDFISGLWWINGRDWVTGQYGISSSIDLALLQDPCDPCPNSPLTKNWNRCKELECSQVFDVGYNFHTLYQAMDDVYGIVDGNEPSSNNFYFTEYVGTLREVLQNWCSDYGWDFYWEDGKIKFIDVRNPITINTSALDMTYCEASTETKSLEGTKSRASISYYERAGETKPYSCNNRTLFNLDPLVIYDYFGKNANYSGLFKGDINNEEKNNKEVGVSTFGFEVACALQHYSSLLRDAYWWYDYYKITGAEAAAGIDILNKSLPPFGGMKILKVISEYPAINNGHYQDCLETITEQLQNRVKKMKGYFLVISGNENELKRASAHEAMYSDMIGRYFFTTTSYRWDGKDEQQSRLQIEGPDGGGNWYGAGTDVKTIPFANLPYDKRTNMDKWINEEGSTQTDNNGATIRRSFILLAREPKWVPESFDRGTFASGLAKLNDFIFEFVGLEGNLSVLEDIDEDYKDNPDVKLIVAYPGKCEVARILSDNPEDDNVVDRKYYPDEIENNCVPAVFKLNQSYQYGLKNKECIKFEIDIDSYTGSENTFVAVNECDFEFYAPSQGLMDDWTPITRGAGYVAIGTHNYSKQILIPKAQTIMQNYTNSEDALAFEVNYRNVTDADIRVLTGTGLCVPNSGIIEAAHELFNSGITYVSDEPSELKSFTFMNFGTNVGNTFGQINPRGGGTSTINALSPADGLVGIDVTYGSDGPRITYNFANRPAQPPSLNVVQRGIEALKTITMSQR